MARCIVSDYSFPIDVLFAWFGFLVALRRASPDRFSPAKPHEVFPK